MSSGSKDYYRVLGVSTKASDEEIKRAFRRLARESHPDVARDKASAEERFKQINEAYDVLGDAAKRRAYDEEREHGAPGRPPPRHGPFRRGRTRGGGFGRDPMRGFGTGAGPTGEEVAGGLFEQLFGRGERGFGRGSRGADVEGELVVSLEDVLHGAVRTLSQTLEGPASGAPSRSTFQVRIPPGVRAGQMIRVPGRGEIPARGEPGDLYLHVMYESHPRFTVTDRDLESDLPLAPWEAVLGVTVEVPTLDGSVSLKIPAGARGGQRLRVRGRGLPDASGHRGDFYVQLRIDVPAEVHGEERQLWEKLAATSRFRPRA